MSQKVELPLDTQCYLCDSYYANVHQIFVIYKCFLCMKSTPYCMPCELKLQRLFGKGYLFKCRFCDKLTNAIEKIEIAPPNNNANVNNSLFKTPSRPFVENNIPISSIRQNNNNSNFIFRSNQDEENNVNNTNKTVVSNFLNDFNKININFAQEQKANNDLGNTSFINNNRNNRNINNPGVSQTNHLLNNSSSLSNFKGINNYSLLTSRNRLNKRLALNESLLEKKRDDSENNHNLNRVNPFRGKFKNLISMKMSKVYNKNNDNADNSFNDFRKNNCDIKNIFLKDNDKANNGLSSNFRNERNQNDNIGYNPFLSNQRGLNYSFIDGKSTPHRLTNDSFEYF